MEKIIRAWINLLTPLNLRTRGVIIFLAYSLLLSWLPLLIYVPLVPMVLITGGFVGFLQLSKEMYSYYKDTWWKTIKISMRVSFKGE